MAVISERLVSWLRAVGEPSRLRLLTLCAQGDLSVSDMAEALGQSEPRVCRHLRILTEAGLIKRCRQGQWVHYRLADEPEATAFVQGLMVQLDRTDPQLRGDRARSVAAKAAAQRGEARSTESRLGRALADFLRTGVIARIGAPPVLLVGIEHLEVLQRAAGRQVECVVLAHSRRSVQAARTFAAQHHIACRVLLAAQPQGLSERDLARVGGPFSTVILDQLAMSDAELARTLQCSHQALQENGLLCLFERYEALESSRDKVVEHPLARLRRLLGEHEFRCERLGPIEADGEHVLAAIAGVTANTEAKRA